MKSLKFTFYFGLLLGFTFLATPAMGSHKGGSMGMASEDLLNSILDYTSAPTMVSASTSGTSGCENWNFVQNNRVQLLELSWKTISEDVAKGQGEYLEILSKMCGCQGEYEQTFKSMLYGNYPHFSEDMKEIDNSYERAHLLDYEINRLIQSYRLEGQCVYSYSS